MSCNACHIARNWGLLHSRCSLRDKGDVSLLKLHGVQTSSVAAVMTLSRAAASEGILTRPPAVSYGISRSSLAPRVKQTPLRCKSTPDEDNGVCVAVDKDGDAWWLSYANKGEDRKWNVVSGTGKYAGMTGSGTTKLLATTPDGRTTISWSGAMRMK
jgi:hypothetical protein